MGKNEKTKKSYVVDTNRLSDFLCSKCIRTTVGISFIVALFSVVLYQAFIVLRDEQISLHSKNRTSNAKQKINFNNISSDTKHNTNHVRSNGSSNFSTSISNKTDLKTNTHDDTADDNLYAPEDNVSNSYLTVPFVACECARPESDLKVEHAKIECAVEDDGTDPGAKTLSFKKLDAEGLDTLRGYLTEEQQLGILEELSHFEFSQYVGKTCLEFGHNYSFYINEPTAEFMPPKIKLLSDRLVKDGVLKEEERPDHILVNKYTPGQGIHSHIDDDWYTDGIASITLMSGAAIEFRRERKNDYYKTNPHLEEKYKDNTLLECGTGYFDPGSLFVMNGESRYAYKHEIKRRKTDRAVYAKKNESGDFKVNSVKHLERKTRISLTFRRVKDEVTRRLYKERITGGASIYLINKKNSIDNKKSS